MIAPRLQFSVLCDEVVAKPDGKMVFWGVFGGLSAVMFPAVHPRMFCVNCWTGGSGEFQETVQLFSPDRSEVLVELQNAVIAANIFASVTNVYDLRGITFAHPGVYWMVINLGRQPVLEYPLNVAYVTAPEAGAVGGLPTSEGEGQGE